MRENLEIFLEYYIIKNKIMKIEHSTSYYKLFSSEIDWTLGGPLEWVDFLDVEVHSPCYSGVMMGTKLEGQLGVDVLSEEQIDYFKNIYDCEKNLKKPYNLNLRLDYYKRRQQELFNLLKIKLKECSLSDEDINFLVTEIDNTMAVILGCINAGDHNYYIYSKKIYDIFESNSSEVLEVSMKLQQKVYIELYNYMNLEINLSFEQINIDVDESEKQKEVQLEERTKLIKNSNYVCNIKSSNRTVNFIDISDEFFGGLVKSVAIDIESSGQEKNIDSQKMSILDFLEEMLGIYNEFYDIENNDYSLYTIKYNGRYIYYNVEDKKLYYDDLPCFFIRIAPDIESQGFSLLKTLNVSSSERLVLSEMLKFLSSHGMKLNDLEVVPVWELKDAIKDEGDVSYILYSNKLFVDRINVFDKDSEKRLDYVEFSFESY